MDNTAPHKDLVMYSRTLGCPFVSIATKLLDEKNIPYRVVMIDKDTDAKQRVLDWTGFLSVPTLVIANPGDDLPCETPAYLEKGTSPRGIDRGPMLTEPNRKELVAWLIKHGLLQPELS